MKGDTMKAVLDYKDLKPKRAHATDAGLDLRSPIDATIPANGGIFIDTGVHVDLPAGTAGLLVSKSGLNKNFGITSTGLIDEAYTGSIGVKLYNHGKIDYQVKKGDKITQLVIIPVLKPSIEIVESLEETDRRDGGFGSSGR